MAVIGTFLTDDASVTEEFERCQAHDSRPVESVTFRGSIRSEVVTVTSWTHRSAPSSARRASPGPRGLRALAREGSAVVEAAPLRPARRGRPARAAGRAVRRCGRREHALEPVRAGARASWPATTRLPAMAAPPARHGLPHLPLADARQRRLHPRGRRARWSAGIEAIAIRREPQGDHRRAQPRRHDGPRAGRAPARPGRRASSRMGSPMLAPGAVHPMLLLDLEMLARLQRAGLGGLMGEDCTSGACARRELGGVAGCRCTPDVAFTAVFSRRDGIVDWRACLDPQAETVEVPHQPPRDGLRPGGARHRRRAALAARTAGRAATRLSRPARLAAVPDAAVG